MVLKVNIGDRGALMRAYPAEHHATDAAAKSAASAETVRGVLVLSAPDRTGEFSFERGRRQVGEAPSAAFFSHPISAGNAGAPEAASGAPDAGYNAFLDDIVAAAKLSGFTPQASPGHGDPRIRGLRQ
jgi:hypothetical protein